MIYNQEPRGAHQGLSLQPWRRSPELGLCPLALSLAPCPSHPKDCDAFTLCDHLRPTLKVYHNEGLRSSHDKNLSSDCIIMNLVWMKLSELDYLILVSDERNLLLKKITLTHGVYL